MPLKWLNDGRLYPTPQLDTEQAHLDRDMAFDADIRAGHPEQQAILNDSALTYVYIALEEPLYHHKSPGFSPTRSQFLHSHMHPALRPEVASVIGIIDEHDDEPKDLF